MAIDCSIIIPIHNAENSLSDTVDSIRRIDSFSIEIILVDDGSTDSSLLICKHLSKADKRIIVCCQKNYGVSSARNHGISKAKGKYIYFIDADDIVFPQVLESLIKSMKNHDLDMAIADFLQYDTITRQKSIITPNLPYNKILRKSFIINNIYRRFYLGDNVGLNNIWNKVFRTEIIRTRGIRFEEGRTHGEDWKFVIDYFEYTNLLMAFPETVYLYQTNGSQHITKYRDGLIKSILGSYSIMEKIRRKGTFELSRKEFEIAAIKQFSGVLEFLKFDVTSDEIVLLKHDKMIKSLSKRIMHISLESIHNANMSRNIYLIAFFLLIGNIYMSKKLIKRGF